MTRSWRLAVTGTAAVLSILGGGIGVGLASASDYPHHGHHHHGDDPSGKCPKASDDPYCGIDDD
ncbi:MAG TPA: hypothetical protein VGM60_04045 [Pseudonocardia sp.]|jgi:hypothetical protein|uniref:hypothetical protein n=1 Tax=Pseudonocardia sp. TaxID=60912 RepID=UPI002F3E7D4B